MLVLGLLADDPTSIVLVVLCGPLWTMCKTRVSSPLLLGIDSLFATRDIYTVLGLRCTPSGGGTVRGIETLDGAKTAVLECVASSLFLITVCCGLTFTIRGGGATLRWMILIGRLDMADSCSVSLRRALEERTCWLFRGEGSRTRTSSATGFWGLFKDGFNISFNPGWPELTSGGFPSNFLSTWLINSSLASPAVPCLMIERVISSSCFWETWMVRVPDGLDGAAFLLSNVTSGGPCFNRGLADLCDSSWIDEFSLLPSSEIKLLSKDASWYYMMKDLPVSTAGITFFSLCFFL